MAGAKALVEAVLKSGMPVAVATSANRKAFELKVIIITKQNTLKQYKTKQNKTKHTTKNKTKQN